MDDEPPRGALLTRTQREMLQDPESMTDQQRYRLRRRVRQGIKDFTHLANQLPEEDRDLIFELTGDEDDAAFYNGVRQMISFAYAGAPDEIDFETLLEFALYDAEIKQHRLSGTTTDVSVEIETREHFDLDDVEEKYRNESELTYEEIGALLASGRLDEEELLELSEVAREHGYTEHFNMMLVGGVMDQVLPSPKNE
jgi:hypothetical protein